MISIDLAMLVVTAINVFGFTLLGSYLAEKSRITSHFDKMFSLYRELRLLKQKPCHPSRIEIRSSEISELQLQIKHLYLEIGNKNIKIAPRLTQPQCRMMADCCEEFLYFNEAKKYWKKCFSYGFQLL